MSINWTKLGAIFTALSFIIALVLLLFSIVPPSEIFGKEEDIKNSDIYLQKTRYVYFSDIVDATYLDTTSNQLDSTIIFDCPDQLYYGNPTSINLKISLNQTQRLWQWLKLFHMVVAVLKLQTYCNTIMLITLPLLMQMKVLSLEKQELTCQ